MITAKDEVIAQRDQTITHREDQILESDTVIIQRNTIIEFLQEQLHDLTLELDDAIAHINVLQEQPAPPDVPEEPESEDEEEDPEEIEGVSNLIPSMENPNLILSPIVLLLAASRLWATSMISSLFQIIDLLNALSVV
jgi:hypothetical protein